MNWHHRFRIGYVSAIAGVCFLCLSDRVLAATMTWTGAAGDGLFETGGTGGNWSGASPFNPPGNLTASASNTTNADRAIFTSGADVTVTLYRKLGGIQLTSANSDTVTISGFASILQTTNLSFLLNPGQIDGDQYTSSNLNNSLDVQGGHLVINGAFDDDDEPLGGEIRFGNQSSAWNVASGSTVTMNLLVGLANTQTQIRKRGAGTVILNGNPTGGNGSSGGGNATSAANAFNWRIEEGTLVGASGAGTQWRANATGVTISNGATVHLTNGTNWGPNAAQTAASDGFKFSQIAGNGVGDLGAIRVSDGDSLLQTGTNAAAGGNPNSFQLAAAGAGIGVDTDASLTVTDDIGGSGALTKLGGGTLILMAKNHYAGDTTVSAGTLLINAQRDDVVKNISAVAAYVPATDTTAVTLDTTTGLSVGQTVSGNSLWVLGSFNATTSSFVRSAADTSLAAGSVTFDGITHALASATVTVKDTATLGGTGKILGSHVVVEEGGTLAPGASIGIFDVGSLNLAGTLAIEMDETNLLINDLLNVVGNLDLTGASAQFSIVGSLTQNSYLLATYGGTLTGAFNPIDAPVGYAFDYDTEGQVRLAAIPEPSTLALLGLGLLGLTALRKRGARK